MNTNTGGYAPDPRRWWERVLSRLFPAQHIEPPEDIEGFAPGYTRTEIHVHMDWLDRLRALCGHGYSRRAYYDYIQRGQDMVYALLFPA